MDKDQRILAGTNPYNNREGKSLENSRRIGGMGESEGWGTFIVREGAVQAAGRGNPAQHVAVLTCRASCIHWTILARTLYQ